MTWLFTWSFGVYAQEFPDQEAPWRVLPCGGGPMIDAWRDESGAVDERDLVGDPIDPTGARAADDDYLYLRMRLDQDPLPGGAPRPFAWAWLLDDDGETSTYEVQILVDGPSAQLHLLRNTETTEPDAPSDPPDPPAVASWALAERARSVPADSSWGDDPDFWLELAVPWEALDEAGIERLEPVWVWAATSSTANTLDGDLACHDGASGEPRTLSGTAGRGTVLDPETDTDGDGFSDRAEVEGGSDPRDPSSVPEGDPDSPLLEGGGGCSSQPLGPSSGALLLAWALYPRRSQRNWRKRRNSRQP